MKCPNFKSPGLVIQTQHSSIWYLDTNTVGAMEQSIGLYQAKWGTKQDICLCQLPGTLPDPALCATQAWPTRQGVPHTRTQQRPCKHWLLQWGCTKERGRTKESMLGSIWRDTSPLGEPWAASGIPALLGDMSAPSMALTKITSFVNPTHTLHLFPYSWPLRSVWHPGHFHALKYSSLVFPDTPTSSMLLISLVSGSRPHEVSSSTNGLVNGDGVTSPPFPWEITFTSVVSR